jgi:myo-inositol-1-phosphate synthase
VKSRVEIASADGRLGVLLVGLGAVSTTFIAGVQAVRKGLALPIGSLTQMGTVRLGKRTEGRSPKIKEIVPLVELDKLVFGGWDIFEENCYAAAKTAGVLETPLLDQVRSELEAIRPWPAVFDSRYVKRLDGPNVKKGRNKRELAEQVVEDIRQFKKAQKLDRLVMIWCGSTEVYMTQTPAHASLEAFEKALEANDPQIPSSMVYSLRQRGAESHRRHPGSSLAGVHDESACRGKRSEDRPDTDQNDHRARPEGETPRCRRLVLDQHPGQP